MWKWQLPNNPHLKRLLRSQPKSVEGEALRLNLAFGVLLGIFGNCFFIQGIAAGLYAKPDYYLLSGFALLIIPLVVSLYITWFTVRDCATEQYQMMRLTDLPNKFIVWGYLRAGWSHMQFLFGLQFGFTLIFLVTSHYFVLSDTLFYTFPYQRNPNTQNFTEIFILNTGLILLGYVGLILCSSNLSVSIGLALRRLWPALGLALMLNSFLLFCWFILVAEQFERFLVKPEKQMLNAAFLLLGFGPIVLWFLSLRLGVGFARRALWN